MTDRRDVVGLGKYEGEVVQILPPDMSVGGEVTAGVASARVDLSGAIFVQLVADGDIFINFGDNTVDAAGTHLRHREGVQVYCVPPGDTHLAYIRAAGADQTVNWRKMGL